MDLNIEANLSFPLHTVMNGCFCDMVDRKMGVKHYLGQSIQEWIK